jgi:uncharacterized protein
MNKPQWTWTNYKGNLEWLRNNTVFLARSGSWAYGTNTPSSDEDWRGIAIPPIEYVFGTLHKFEQAEIKTPDCVIFDIRKFVSLASQANPNVIELLFTDPEDVVIEKTVQWESIRYEFLTKRVRHTYSGYAMGQLKRISLHQKYLTNPPKRKPERKDFGLPEETLVPGDQLKVITAEIQKKIDSWSHSYLDDLEPGHRTALVNRFTEHLADIQIASQDDLWLPAARTLGASDNLIEAMKKERGYSSAKRQYDNYLEWQKNRNPDRAALEAKYLYDTKHGAHLVRLLRQCREILTGQGVIVKRPDAEELLSIRNGAWSYEKIIDFAENEDKELQVIAQNSNLPNAPDINKIDNWLVSVLEGWYGTRG